jgi:two-component system sensor histidine kinase BaeS
VSSLRGRIGLALLAFGLTTLVVVGGSLWVALRDLHREAAIGSLTELSTPYAGLIRQRLPGNLLRLAPEGEFRRGEIVERFREARERRGENVEQVAAFIQEVATDGDVGGISVVIVQGDQSFVVNPADGSTDQLPSVPAIEAFEVAGQVTTGSTEIDGIGQVVYAAAPIRSQPLRERTTQRERRPLAYVLLARADDSARLATADLLRAITLAGFVLLIVGIPLAAGLSRSVANPLRRLSAATATVAAGQVPEPLPTDGPVEVADASAAFNAMAAEVGATREAQRQLLADIRHDLRTPLTVIGGFSEALRDGTATGETAVRAADAISDETGRLERMLDDLDHLTVPGVAGPPLRLEALESRALAAAAVERFAAEAESRGQVIDLREPAVSTTLTADPDVLDRILGNVIANALTHAPSPGGHVSIEVAPTTPESTPPVLPGWVGRPAVILAVRDDGPGIPTAALPHVFDRFYRADPSRSRRGSGLGLAIVRDLAEALGGQAFAENPAGGGARVGVVLPVSGPPAQA